MIKGLFTGLDSAFHKFFPERQFYHRSHGEVHFISLSGRTQVIYLALTLAFLTWVGFTSVNVVFKQQIIAQKERNEYMMSQKYLQRIRELERAFEKAQARLVVATSEFNRHIEDLENRHAKLKEVVDHQSALRANFDTMQQVHASNRVDNKNSETGANRILLLAGEMSNQGRQSRFDSQDGADGRTVAATLGKIFRDSVVTASGRSPLDALEDKVTSLHNNQKQLVYQMQENSHRRIAHAETVIRTTGLPLKTVVAEYDPATYGTGGPFIALKDADSDLVETSDDEGFESHLFRLRSKLERLNTLEDAIATMPLVNPVNDDYRVTSTFGVRRDPFTKKVARHHGLDMAASYGSPIVATANGVVAYAGRKGAYGNVVEIDHGHGFKTRYGHLKKILVKKGQKVSFYQTIAEVGSTGRSTGPHLHYEVWFENQVRNPAKFLEAGSYVFKK